MKPDFPRLRSKYWNLLRLPLNTAVFMQVTPGRMAAARICNRWRSFGLLQRRRKSPGNTVTLNSPYLKFGDRRAPLENGLRMRVGRAWTLRQTCILTRIGARP